MVEPQIHRIERNKPDIKEYKQPEAQKQAEINPGVRSQGRVAYREEGWGLGRGLKILF